MRIYLPAATIAIFGVLCAQAAVWGQTTRSMFGTSSTLGSSLSAGTRTFGSGGTFGTASGQLGTSGGSAAFQDFVRSAQQGLFTGRTAQQTGGFAGVVQAGQNVNRQAQTGPAQRRAAGQRGGAAPGGRRTNTQIRTRIRLGFGYPRTVPARVSTALAGRLVQMKRIRTLSPVKVSIQGETATLRGVVATAYDRDLAEQMARLEPGIWKVENELLVAAGPAEP